MLKTVGNPSIRYGNQTILDGNLVIGTAGKGIDFSADPSAPGMTSELLDDYEEGTWTPAYSAASGSFTTLTYTLQTARYIKIGQAVCIQADLSTASVTVGTASGNLSVTGFPFASSTNGSMAIGFSSAWNATNLYAAMVSGPSMMIYKRTAFNSANTLVQVSDMTTGAGAGNNRVDFGGVYFTSA